MKRSSIWCASILIALALLLSAAKNVSAQDLGPSQNLPQQRNNATQNAQTNTEPNPPSAQAAQTPSAENSPGRERGPKQGRADPDKDADWLWQAWEWLNGITAQGFFTFVTAAATVLMAIFTGLLWCVSDQQKELAQAAEKIELRSVKASEHALDINRPFLLVTGIKGWISHVDPMEIAPEMPFRHHFYFDIAIRNYGVSPADIVDYTADADLFDPPYRDPYPVYGEVGQFNDSVISPAESILEKVKAAHSLTDNEWGLMQSDEKRMAVFGRIRYRGASPTVFTTFFFWWCLLDAAETLAFARALPKRLNDHT